MSIRIALENPPEFYTNLDILRGQVLLSLSRHEQVGAIIVKLEGESRTALGIPVDNSTSGVPHRDMPSSGDVIYENHKILYKVAQAFPNENAAPSPGPIVLNPGQHRFPFQFKFPFNNACGNTEAMARIGGVVNASGFAPGGMFGLGGIRVMDGTKQLMYSHVTKTLPPSFTGLQNQAEIRYYVKVTIQRPGIFKENWRYQIGLKFLPIEPPRPPKTNQEAYARRPFTFQPRTPDSSLHTKRSSLFSGRRTPQPPGDRPPEPEVPPSIEMSARLPHPAILTCNKPIPLRLIAKKLVASNAEVYLTGLQIELIGKTIVRCQDLINVETSPWIIVSRGGLSIPVSSSSDAVGTEITLPDTIWSNIPLPNTVMPSFQTCNLGREYRLEVRLSLSWGKPTAQQSSSSYSFFGGSSNKGKSKLDISNLPQQIHLPLSFSSVEVYSGLSPPPQLVEAMRSGRRRPQQQQSGNPPLPNRRPTSATEAAFGPQPPQLPPRRPTNQQAQPAPQPAAPAQASGSGSGNGFANPLYPPQLGPGQEAPPYDDAPPTYEEAMAEEMTGPAIPAERPAYSGVTDENAAEIRVPEKRG
ncbi:hypothetical protein QBC38DRAFT_370407 [Podospora fimiseda]|uniref:Arrestin-like N-terminal domain-containing protein n=1 Tax=Podospora fimiseda TaxID=252190 RepID=A0AAN7GQP9_9PEZI|nr:hypothetical protein QBC38DRAFT_370407 [Podospora fimiseda]